MYEIRFRRGEPIVDEFRTRREQVIELARRGFRADTIADAVGLSPGYVYRIIARFRRQVVPPTGQPRTERA